MTHFIKQGSQFLVTDSANVDIRSKLPPEAFIVGHNPRDGFFLERVNDMLVPAKLYGSAGKNRDRIMQTFKDREQNTGILLSGDKGAGKTMLMRALSIEVARDFEGPTIIVNAPFHGDEFNKFVQSIEQPCIFAFDEFEKIYNNDQQGQILTLLDGLFSGKKMFIFTCNSSYKISEHMLNRPGRVFYHLKYRGIEEQAIREYCQDELVNQEHIESVVKIGKIVDTFSFDSLKNLVQEMNRYGEDAFEAIQLMNIAPESSHYTSYKVTGELNGIPMDVWGNIEKSPLTAQSTTVYARVKENLKTKLAPALLDAVAGAIDDGEDYDDEEATARPTMVLNITPSHLVTLRDDGGMIFLVDGVRLEYRKKTADDYTFRPF